MDPVQSLCYIGPRMDHVIIYCTSWVLDRDLCKKKTLSDFVKFWIPVNGIQRCGIELQNIHRHSAS